MRYSTITNNIIKDAKVATNLDESLYIQYDAYNPIFDAILAECVGLNLIDKQIPDNDKPIFSYNAYWCNHPLDYIDYRQDVKFNHLKDIVFFHQYPENNIKKEDKFLLQNSLGNSIKICPNDDIQKAWGLNTAYTLEYGVPIVETHNADHDKSILLIDHTHSNQIKLLQSYIQKAFSDASVLNIEKDSDWQTISSTIKQYKLCIVFSSYIDILACLSCGCMVISTLPIKEDYVAHVTDFSNIIDITNHMLDIYNHQKMLLNSDSVITRYNFDKFEYNIVQLLRQISKQPFIL